MVTQNTMVIQYGYIISPNLREFTMESLLSFAWKQRKYKKYLFIE